jgi:hypothetical protein
MDGKSREECLRIDLGSQRHLFEVPDDVAYFNTANMSPLLCAVRDAGESGLARLAAPWQVAAADWFGDVERLRCDYAEVLCAGTRTMWRSFPQRATDWPSWRETSRRARR